jgi:hypothetical protein
MKPVGIYWKFTPPLNALFSPILPSYPVYTPLFLDNGDDGLALTLSKLWCPVGMGKIVKFNEIEYKKYKKLEKSVKILKGFNEIVSLLHRSFSIYFLYSVHTTETADIYDYDFIIKLISILLFHFLAA